MIDNTPSSPNKLRLLEYLRVSTLKQKKDVTIETQKRENGLYKQSNTDKFEIVATYMDDGKSGFKFGVEERPEFNNLLEQLYSDTSIDGIFSYDLDRIGRDGNELQILGRNFLKENKVIWTATKGLLTQDTPEGEFIYGIFSLLTQLDANIIKRKLRAGRERIYAENLIKGLPKTYGFGRKEKVIPKNIKEKMIKWYKKGYGFKEIQKRMQNEPFDEWDEERKVHIQKKGFKLSTSTIGKRLREWDLKIRQPKYSKSQREKEVELEEKYEQKFKEFIKGLKDKN